MDSRGISQGRTWTREETMLAFEYYCTTSKKDLDNKKNPSLMALAVALSRPPGSVYAKLQNFKSCDPSYTYDGKVGLGNASKLDKEICNEFLRDWNALVNETNRIKINLNLLEPAYTADTEEQETYIGGYVVREQNVRVGQTFFRKAVLSAYNYKCCFTGISVLELLRASHIKPWSASNDINEKTNPQNGILLNALHDAAFDRGLMTITTDHKILVSGKLLRESNNNQYFERYHGQKMMLPTRFLPSREFIEHHNSRFIN